MATRCDPVHVPRNLVTKEFQKLSQGPPDKVMFHANWVYETHPQCLQEAQRAEAGDYMASQGGTKWTKLARLPWQTVSPGLGKHDKHQPTGSKSQARCARTLH